MYIEDGFTLNLVAARKNRNLSRKTVAETVGVTERTIGSWENCVTSPSAKQVAILSDLYQVPSSLLRFTP